MYYTRNILLLYYNFLHFMVFILTIDNFLRIYNLQILVTRIVTFISSFFLSLKEQNAFFQLVNKIGSKNK